MERDRVLATKVTVNPKLCRLLPSNICSICEDREYLLMYFWS